MNLIKKSIDSKSISANVIRIIKLNKRILINFLHITELKVQVISKNKAENPKILSEKQSSKKPHIIERPIVLFVLANIEKANANGKIKKGFMLFGKFRTLEFCNTKRINNKNPIKSHFLNVKADLKFFSIGFFLFLFNFYYFVSNLN